MSLLPTDERPTCADAEPTRLTARDADGVERLRLVVDGARLLAPVCEPDLAGEVNRWRSRGVPWLQWDERDGAWKRGRLLPGRVGFLDAVGRWLGQQRAGWAVEVGL